MLGRLACGALAALVLAVPAGAAVPPGNLLTNPGGSPTLTRLTNDPAADDHPTIGSDGDALMVVVERAVT